MSDPAFGRRAAQPKPSPIDSGGYADADRVGNDFQSDAAAIEEAPVPLSSHIALLITVVLLATAVIWSIVGKVDRIVVAPGKVATKSPMLVMQSFSTARVVDITVKPGDHVHQGQVLVKFDASFAQADV